MNSGPVYSRPEVQAVVASSLADVERSDWGAVCRVRCVALLGADQGAGPSVSASYVRCLMHAPTASHCCCARAPSPRSAIVHSLSRRCSWPSVYPSSIHQSLVLFSSPSTPLTITPSAVAIAMSTSRPWSDLERALAVRCAEEGWAALTPRFMLEHRDFTGSGNRIAQRLAARGFHRRDEEASPSAWPVDEMFAAASQLCVSMPRWKRIISRDEDAVTLMTNTFPELKAPSRVSRGPASALCSCQVLTPP